MSLSCMGGDCNLRISTRDEELQEIDGQHLEQQINETA